MVLKKNDRAPYFGVLVPEERYRTYQEQLEVCDIFNHMRAMPEPQDPEPDPVVTIFWTSVTFLAIGLAGGMYLASDK